NLATDADRHTLSDGDGGVMSKFERLLEAGSTELPDFRCADLMAIVPMAGGGTRNPIFLCPKGNHELRQSACGTDVLAARNFPVRESTRVRRSNCALLAIRRASSSVSSLAAERRPGSSSK